MSALGPLFQINVSDLLLMLGYLNLNLMYMNLILMSTNLPTGGGYNTEDLRVMTSFGMAALAMIPAGPMRPGFPSGPGIPPI